MRSRTDELLAAAFAAIDAEQAGTADKVEMLVEVAMGLQAKPKSPDELHAAVSLYERALDLLDPKQYLERARVMARMGTALQAIPSETSEHLRRARECYESVRKILVHHGSDEEVAELEMNLGLVLQALSEFGQARITDAIAAYQRALRTFDAKAHAKEYAILHNNLATAFLSIPFSDERAKMREALAVQSFEEGLKVVTLIDHPAEYAMLQNNLGNALQYVSSSHAVENNLRAIAAYDEALKVRTPETTPLAYANTIANKANCLCNLPDDPEAPDAGNAGNLIKASRYYEEARAIFARHGEPQKASIVAEALDAIVSELGAAPPAAPVNGAASERSI